MKSKLESLVFDNIEIIKESLNEIEAEYVLASLAAIRPGFTYSEAISEIIDNVKDIYSDRQVIEAIQTIGLMICRRSPLVGEQMQEDLGPSLTNAQALEYYNSVSKHTTELLVQVLEQHPTTQPLGTSEIVQPGSE